MTYNKYKLAKLYVHLGEDSQLIVLYVLAGISHVLSIFSGLLLYIFSARSFLNPNPEKNDFINYDDSLISVSHLFLCFIFPTFCIIMVPIISLVNEIKYLIMKLNTPDHQ